LILSCAIVFSIRWLRPGVQPPKSDHDGKRRTTRGLRRSCPQPLPPAPGQGNSETGRCVSCHRKHSPRNDRCQVRSRRTPCDRPADGTIPPVPAQPTPGSGRTCGDMLLAARCRAGEIAHTKRLRTPGHAALRVYVSSARQSGRSDGGETCTGARGAGLRPKSATACWTLWSSPRVPRPIGDRTGSP
jgi:hypothetical protein